MRIKFNPKFYDFIKQIYLIWILLIPDFNVKSTNWYKVFKAIAIFDLFFAVSAVLLGYS